MTQTLRSKKLKWLYSVIFLVLGSLGLLAVLYVVDDPSGSMDNVGLVISLTVMSMIAGTGYQLGPKLHKLLFRPAGSGEVKTRKTRNVKEAERAYQKRSGFAESKS